MYRPTTVTYEQAKMRVLNTGAGSASTMSTLTTTPTYSSAEVRAPCARTSVSPRMENSVKTAVSSDVGENSVAVTTPAKQHSRDSSWLELEICREHMRGSCPRSSEECRFAHPEPSLAVKGGIVTCCYDFLKDRCQREHCKYFHPPVHIKQRLVVAGKQFGAMHNIMSSTYIMTGAPYPAPIPANPLSPTDIINGQVISSPGSPGFIPTTVMTPYNTMNERLQMCPDFALGLCNVHLCPLVHPEPYVRRNFDSTVTLCRDFARGMCSREHCRYYHPPPHIAVQLEAAAASITGFVSPQ